MKKSFVLLHLPLKSLTRFHHWLLYTLVGAVVLILLLFRFLLLDVTPPGFYLDESSIGYNAYLIWKTGLDEHGSANPLYFEAFGDYKNPVYIYSVVPLLALFGVSEWSVRLAAALYTALALAVFTFMLLRARAAPWVLVVTTLLIGSSPWFVLLGRVAFELAAFPLFLLAACGCLFGLLSEKSANRSAERAPFGLRSDYLLAAGFGLSLGILFYTYTSARLLVPLLLLGGAVVIFQARSAVLAMLAVGACAVCFFPLLVQPELVEKALIARYQVVGLSRYTDGTMDFTATAVGNYFSHLRPGFWLAGGDFNYRHAPTPFGILLPAGLAALLTGIFAALRTSRTRGVQLFFRWCLFGLLLAPLPAALTIQAPHVLRSIGLLPFAMVFIWQGVAWWYRSKLLIVKVIGYGLLWLAVVQSFQLLSYLTNAYPRAAAAWYETDLVAAAAQAARLPGPYFLSTALEPGGQVTLRFQAAKAGMSLADPATPIFLYDPFSLKTVQPGTYILSERQCGPSSNFRYDLDDPGFTSFGSVCVITVKEQPPFVPQE